MQRKPRTRALLLGRMIAVSAEAGYHSASVGRILGVSGIARSTFYEHFAEKDECFLSALKLIGIDFIRGLATALAERGGGLETFIRIAVRFSAEDPAAAKVLFVESLAAGPRAHTARAKVMDEAAALLDGQSGSHPAKGQVAATPATVVCRGVFRLLAIRLRSAEGGCADLLDGLLAWVGAGEWAEGFPAPVSGRRPSIRPLATEALPRLEVGEPGLGPSSVGGRGEVERRQRLRILAALAHCGYERGYNSVTVEEIAAQAGVSRKAFYRLFGDKAGAARELNERVFQAGMAAGARGFFSAATWPERAWASGYALLSFLGANREGSYLAFVESAAISDAAIGQAYELAGAFTLFLEEGYRYRPESEALPRSVSAAVMATIFEWAFHELRERRSLEGLLASLPQLSYVVVAPFMGAEAAAEFVASKAREHEGR